MSGEAVRDVTIRVGVVGGKVDGLSKIGEHLSTADAYMKNINVGMKELTAEARLMSSATEQFAENIKSAAGVKLGDLGLGEARAAVEDISAAMAGMGDIGDVGLDGVKAAVDEISGAVENVPPIDLGGGEAKTDADKVKSAIESLNEEISQSTAGLEASWAAADELAAAGQKVKDDLAASLATAAQEAENLAQAELDAKYKVEDATKSVETATKSLETATTKEAQSAAESAFKKIALSERLAAHNRAAAKEAEKLGQIQQKEMFAATGAIAGALAAGTQFVSTIKLIAGESPEIEELARQFAQVQGVVAGIAAGTQAFNGINQGLTSLQSAAAAATAQLAATGGTATMTQTALIRLAPAAATAQAALGPIGLAIAGISLAIATVKAASHYFSEEMPDDTDRNARAYERVNNQLADMKRKLDANARSMEAQNRMLQVEFDLRQKIAGETTIENIDEQVNKDIKAASDVANTATDTEKIEAAKRLAALQDERRRLAQEMEQLNYKDTWSEATYGTLFGEAKKDPFREERKKQIQNRLEQLTPQALNEARGAEGLGAALTAETIGEYAAAIQKLPEEQRSVYEETLSKFEESLKTSLSSATDELQSKLRDNEQALKDNKRSVDDATKAYQDEQNTALRLQASPTERKALEQSVTAATATGNLYEGIDALSGVVSSDREQQLRNQLAQGNLTRQKLLEEIADAAEFETEKAELEKQVATLNKQADALDATREQLTKAQQRVEDKMRKLSEDIAATQMAQQAR